MAAESIATLSKRDGSEMADTDFTPTRSEPEGDTMQVEVDLDDRKGIACLVCGRCREQSDLGNDVVNDEGCRAKGSAID